MKRADLLEYLFAEYHSKLDEKEHELTPEAEEMFESFIEFCRRQLRTVNPAVSVFTIDTGLGLRLANNTEVSLVVLPPQMTANGGAMPVTDPMLVPANSGISSISSVPIFGNDS